MTRPSNARSPLLRALLPALALAVLTTCGGAQSRLDGPPLTAPQALADAHRHHRAHRHADVVSVANRARSQGVLTPDLQALEVVALWQLDQAEAADKAEQALASRALTTGPLQAAALDASFRAVREGIAVQRPLLAIRLLVRVLPTGCGTGQACRLAGQALLAASAETDEWRGQVAVLAPPAAGPIPRSRWLRELSNTLGKAGKAALGVGMLEEALRTTPQDAELWVTLLDLLRRVPGQDAGAVWLERLTRAKLPSHLWTTLAAVPDVAVDRSLSARLLAAATTLTDADEDVWVRYAVALGRTDDRVGLQKLANDKASGFTTRRGRVALVRGLLLGRLTDLARPLVQELAAQRDGVGMAFQAELAMDEGKVAEGKALGQQAFESAADRSQVALLLAELWRKRAPDEARRYLTLAAETPGTGQRTAARLRAEQELVAKAPGAAATQIVLHYARLLSSAQPAVADEGEPDPESARRWLARQLEERSAWRDVWTAVLRVYAATAVAEPKMLRELSLRALQDSADEEFLDLDNRARAAANAQGLDWNPRPVLEKLLVRSGSILARWLSQGETEEIDDAGLAWGIADRLLASEHALLGRQHAARARQRFGDDVRLPVLSVMAMMGAADLVLELLAEQADTADPNQVLPRRLVEAQALLALDRAAEAARRLADLAHLPDLPARQLRPALEMAANQGLCGAVLELAPRLLADPDVAGVRAAITLGIDCARQLQDENAAKALVAGLRVTPPDPNRLELAARELTINGFASLGVTVFQDLDQLRPMPENTLFEWGRALLAAGRPVDANQVLRRMTGILRGRQSRAFARAGLLCEEFGALDQAAGFYQSASQLEPADTDLRVRLIGIALMQGRTEGLSEQIQAVVRQGPSPDNLRELDEAARRSGQQKLLRDAVLAVPDAGRDIERFRIELATRLGDRDPVVTGVRRLLTRGDQASAQAAAWLSDVGALREAREVAEDVIAAPDAAGAGKGRQLALRLALALRRDPASAEEALGLARLYTGRATDAADAQTEAALELSRTGLVQQAFALVAMPGRSSDTLRTCVEGHLALRAGKRARGLDLLQRSRAGLVLEASASDWRDDRSSVLRQDGMDVRGAQLICILHGMTDAGEVAAATAWLQEWVDQAPESSMLRRLLVLHHLLGGDVTGAIRALQQAARTLPTFDRDDFELLADETLRLGGGPELLRWFAEEGDGLRTESWLLAFADTVLAATHPPADDPRLAPLRQALQTLPARRPELRVALALRWSQRGEAEAAARLLGKSPLAAPETSVLPPADPREGPYGTVQSLRALSHGAIGAVAAVLVALDTPGSPGGKPHIPVWLQLSHGVDSASLLDAQLVMQGHPNLAVWSRPASGEIRFPELPGDNIGAGLLARFVAARAPGAPPEGAVAAALQMLRGQRNREGVLQVVYADLLGAGRFDLARRLTTALREAQPGLLPADLGAVVSDGADLESLAAGYHPAALPRLRKDAGKLTRQEGFAALGLAVAADPALAETLAAALAGREDEAWRVWLLLLNEAVAFEDGPLAQRALQRAADARAPAAVLACPSLWLRKSGTLAACLRDRPLEVMEDRELGDLALAVALKVDPAGAQDLMRRAALAPVRDQARLLGAAAGRVWAVDGEATAALTQLARDLLQGATTPAARDLVTQRSMDALAVLGLGDLAAEAFERDWQHDPTGMGQRNNLAYARLLAGQAPQKVLEFAAPIATSPASGSAQASLDTLAAALWAAGQRTQALELQRKAAAAAITPPPLSFEPRADRDLFSPAEPDGGAGLPMIRLAEMLLAMSLPDEAREAAVQGLVQAEDPSTAGRARRVLKALLRVPATPTAAP